MKYNSQYIFPPRPENKLPRAGLEKFDNGTFFAQPKFNGSCAEIYTGSDVHNVMNRHKAQLTGFKIPKTEIRNLIHNNGMNLIVGEYMNKSKKDHTCRLFNHKFVIIDLLVVDGEYLLGTTYDERVDMMYDMFKFSDENDYSYKITDNIYMTKTFYTGFNTLWDNFVKTEMLEGLVLKRKNAGLEMGATEKNNVKSMLKIRKETKNYRY
jgi:hypothetical protein